MAATTDILVRYKADVSDLVNESQKAENAVKEAGKAGKKAGDDTAAAFDKAGKQAKEFGKEAKGAKKETSVLSEGINKLGGMIAGAFAVESIISFGKASIEAFKQAEAAAKKLEFAIKNIAGGDNSAFKKLMDQASQLESISIFSDDSITQTQVALAQYGLTTDQIAKLTPKILDLASATGDDLGTATSKVIAAMSGQTKGLKESGLAFKDTGYAVGNMNAFLEKSEKFAGATGDALETAAGKAAQAANEIDNLQEEIGSKLAPVETLFFQGMNYLITGSMALWHDLSNVIGIAIGQQKTYAQEKAGEAATKGTLEIIAAVKEGNVARLGYAAGLVQTWTDLQKLANEIDSNTTNGQEQLAAYSDARKALEEEMKGASAKQMQMDKTAAEIAKLQQEDITKLKVDALKKEIEAIEARDDADQITVKDEITRRTKQIEIAQRLEDKAAEERKKKAEAAAAKEAKVRADAFAKLAKEIEAIDAAAGLRRADDLAGIEDDRFKKEIDKLGLEGRTKEKLTELELAAVLNLEEEHQTNLTKIRVDALQKEQDERDKKTALIKEQNKLQEQMMQDQADTLAADSERAMIERGDNERKIQKAKDKQIQKNLQEHLDYLKSNTDASYKDIAEAELALAKQTEKIRMDSQKDVADNFSQLLTELEKYQQKRFDMINQATSNEISLQDKNIERQKELANKGLANTLAFEERKAAELKVRQMREQKQQERIKKLEVFLNTFAEGSKTMKPAQALAAALKAVAMAELGSMIFAEKGGIIGEISDRTGIKGGMFTKSHGSGDRLVMASPNEAILSERDMRALGGKQGFYDLRKMLHSGDFDMQGIPKMYSNFSPVGINAGINIDALVKEQKKTTEALQRIPVIHTGFDDVGNVVETWQRGLDKKITIIKSKKNRTA